MKTFVFCSFKGGTAKTSSVLHLGACLGRYHQKKVLLIDFDSQANLSVGFGIGPDNLNTMVPVLQGQKKITEVIQKTSVTGVDIIAANTYLDGIESTSPLVSDLYAHERLRKSLVSLPYDYCFIDTPPSLGWLTQSAFFASDYSIICAIPEPYSILALDRLKNYHAFVQDHHKMCCGGVIITFWDERGITNIPILKAIEDSFPNAIFPTKIGRSISVSRAAFKGMPTTELNPESKAAHEYRSLTQEFEERFSTSLVEKGSL